MGGCRRVDAWRVGVVFFLNWLGDGQEVRAGVFVTCVREAPIEVRLVDCFGVFWFFVLVFSNEFAREKLSMSWSLERTWLRRAW